MALIKNTTKDTGQNLEIGRRKRSFFKMLNLPSMSPIKIIFGIIFIAVIAFGAWSFVQYQNTNAQLKQLSTVEGQQAVAQKETQDLLNKVGQFIILPKGETPIVATITDPDKLAAGQAFYQGSIKGDKVLVYNKAKKAIIYSPSRNVLVNVGPAFLQPQSGIDQTDNAVAQENIGTAAVPGSDTGK
ncbi:MAG: hypothetical protein PHZ04_02425 [Patescibacteria group bacterium]|nr:hypothetical protein [Patescibacteria group bacterium]MDD5294685.1 hypothetical protein [Patescibacteria group bacterium]MDD5554457.1 hypothetical protein [Patescibacteria group bacterium]